MKWLFGFAGVLVLNVGCGGSTEGDDEGAESEGEEGSECSQAVDMASGDACDNGSSCICASCEDYCDSSNLASLPDTDVLVAENDDFEAGATDADFACLGSNTPPAPPANDVTVGGIVMDFQTDAPISGALVEAFSSSESLDTSCANATSIDDGTYEITVPADCFVAARLSWRVTVEDALPTLHLNQRVACESEPCTVEQHRISVSQGTADTIPAILGTVLKDGTSIVVGDILDCQRRSVEYANGRLFDDKGAAIGGIQGYFFKEEFPVRRSIQQWTSLDGLVVLVQVPAGGLVDIRAYGNLGGEETLLSSVRVPPIADSVIITDMEPLAE